ncbi:MAG: hypothetical protein BZY82_00205 [SAR202 cluster bacterium Io17-Chloro-G3]|nr:MAG: hypothetical protein BZY82_00205 [SAR202 cluster bacterium Io17-Chloro-G3]
MGSEDRFCWSCGSGIWGNDQFCRKCGTDLNKRVPLDGEHVAEPEVTQPQFPTDTKNGSKEGLYTLGVILGWSIAALGAISAIMVLLQDLSSGLSSYWLLSNQVGAAIIVGVGILIARRCEKARRRLQRISHTNVSAPVTTHRSFREYISKALPVINDYLDPFLRPIERIFNRWKWARYSLLVVAMIIPATLFLIQDDRYTDYLLTPEHDPTAPPT